MFIVAITGGIATGKSSVTKIFAREGVPIVDADLIAREVVEPGKPAWKKIRTEFGDVILNNDKSINREQLGRIIFADVEKRRFLNEATHPEIHSQMYRQIIGLAMAGHNFVLVDLPLLFETGVMLPYVHKIVTVVCEPELQLERLMARNQYSEADAKQRIAAQMPLDEKCKLSHFVIENSGSPADTEAQALRILAVLRKSRQHWKVRGIIVASAAVFFALFAWLLHLKYGFLAALGL